MGKRTKSREAQRFAAEQIISARLRACSKTKKHPPFIGSFCEFDPCYRAKVEAYRAFALRAPEQWSCVLRKRSPELRFMELVRFTFARYPVAQHLENCWIRNTPDGCAEQPDFHRWYIVAAQGGSLYKHVAHVYMSKLETHHFLTAPQIVDCPQRAFWYAFARAQVDDTKVAFRIARSKLIEFSPQSPFWKDVARYFASNPVSIPEMNDLIDFFQAAHHEDDSFSLTGRTLPALRRRMEEWHRALRESKIVFGETWPGVPLPNVEYGAKGELGRAIWRFRQIKTEYGLFKEGERIRHCVLSYKNACVRGDISIWSLRCEYPLGKLNRGVTIEVRKDGTIVQCRGFANRLPYLEEVETIKLWASKHGLFWQAVGP